MDVGQKVVLDAAHPQTEVPAWVVRLGSAYALAGLDLVGLVHEDVVDC